jgi:pyrroline-5-carboxylate reductase
MIENIGIIGFGNMGKAIGTALAALNKGKVCFYDIAPKTETQRNLYQVKNPAELIKNSDVTILAIKPQDIKTFIETHKNAFIAKKPLFITIAAGLNIKFFEKHLTGVKVIRVMPNLAARVGESISFICKGRLASANDIGLAREIFNTVGKTALIDERSINKATAIAGCGPGFVYHIMNSIYQGAVKAGFDRETAKAMINQVFLGAAKLSVISGKDFGVLADEVTSRKGMTEAGRKVFKAKHLDKIIAAAIDAARKRGDEIAKIYS